MNLKHKRITLCVILNLSVMQISNFKFPIPEDIDVFTCKTSGDIAVTQYKINTNDI